MKTSAYIVRRARLLQGMTQAEFAERFNVDNSTVSRWERGLLEPSAPTYARICQLTRSRHPFSYDVIEASPVFKFLARMNDLKEPMVLSKGARNSLARIGYSAEDFMASSSAERSALWAKPSEPTYPWSFSYALTLIQAEPRWLGGAIAYVEMHAYSPTFGQWGRALVAPIPDEGLAIIEGVLESRPSEEFWIRYQDGLPDDSP
jgi:transcriptional regulator with XRE-family HTH domain